MNEDSKEVSYTFTFTFPGKIDREIVETEIALAVVDAQMSFGQPKVRENLAYVVSPDASSEDGKTRVIIDVSDKIGQSVAKGFTDRMVRQLKERS